ncbi:unnamed protein product [Cunninghamella blakesleeana]
MSTTTTKNTTNTTTMMNSNTSSLDMNQLIVNDIELLNLLNQPMTNNNLTENEDDPSMMTTMTQFDDISTPTIALLDWEDWENVTTSTTTTTTSKKRKLDSSNTSLCSSSSSDDEEDEVDEVDENNDFLNQFDFVDVDFNHQNNDTIKDDIIFDQPYKKRKFINEDDDDDISSLLHQSVSKKNDDLDYRWVLDLTTP